MSKEKEYVKLDEKVAVQIMGWKPHYDDGCLISFMTNDDKLLFFCDDPSERDWKPSLELFQAFQVIDALRRNKDIYLDVKCDLDGYSLSAYIDGTLYEYHKRVQLTELPLWICEIALESIKPKEPIPVVTAVIRKG